MLGDIDSVESSVCFQLLLYFLVLMSIRHLIARFESQDNGPVAPVKVSSHNCFLRLIKIKFCQIRKVAKFVIIRQKSFLSHRCTL